MLYTGSETRMQVCVNGSLLLCEKIFNTQNAVAGAHLVISRLIRSIVLFSLPCSLSHDAVTQSIVEEEAPLSKLAPAPSALEKTGRKLSLDEKSRVAHCSTIANIR